MKIDENYFKVERETRNRSLEDMLDPEVKILWEARPKKSAYISAAVLKMLPIVILWLAVDIFFMVMFFPRVPKKLIIVLCCFFALHLIPVWIWIRNIVRASIELRNLRYAITEKRILIQSGSVQSDFKSLYLHELTGAQAKVNWLDKRLHVGDLYLSAMTQTAVLYDIRFPYEMEEKFRKIILENQKSGGDVPLPTTFVRNIYNDNTQNVR